MNIFVQDAAVKAVCRALRRARVGLGDPLRPLASFIFSGPSGVGKTAVCKVNSPLSTVILCHTHTVISLNDKHTR
jgi:ATP-dependent Clp protease ATP-binding subunit ClpA